MIKRIIIILFGAFSLLSCEKVGDSPLPVELKNTNNAQITNNKISSEDIINYIKLTYPQTKSEDVTIASIV